MLVRHMTASIIGARKPIRPASVQRIPFTICARWRRKHFWFSMSIREKLWPANELRTSWKKKWFTAPPCAAWRVEVEDDERTVRARFVAENALKSLAGKALFEHDFRKVFHHRAESLQPRGEGCVMFNFTSKSTRWMEGLIVITVGCTGRGWKIEYIFWLMFERRACAFLRLSNQLFLLGKLLRWPERSERLINIRRRAMNVRFCLVNQLEAGLIAVNE